MKIEDYACRQFLTNEMIPRFEPITKFLYPKETYSSLYKIDDFLGWFTPEMCDFIIRFSVKFLKKKPVTFISPDYGNLNPDPDIAFELSINNQDHTHLELLIDKIKHLLENSNSILSVSGASVCEVRESSFFVFENTYVGQKESMTFIELCKWVVNLQVLFPEIEIT